MQRLADDQDPLRRQQFGFQQPLLFPAKVNTRDNQMAEIDV